MAAGTLTHREFLEALVALGEAALEVELVHTLSVRSAPALRADGGFSIERARFRYDGRAHVRSGKTVLGTYDVTLRLAFGIAPMDQRTTLLEALDRLSNLEGALANPSSAKAPIGYVPGSYQWEQLEALPAHHLFEIRLRANALRLVPGPVGDAS